MGAIGLAHSSPDGEAAVRRMLAAAPHRGTAVDVERAGETVVGSATTLDAPSAWVARRGDRLAAVAGAIDDLPQLAAELGIDPATPADTALAAFDRWGDGAFVRLRGAFSVVVSDGERVRCIRDRFGTTPLFWGASGGAFFAATEPKQVVAGANIAREPDLDSLERIFYGDVEDTTAVRGVRRVPRASTAEWRGGPEPAVRRYWDPRELVETARLGVDEAVERLREILERAVARRLSGADAILLSGGIDSPALAALAARIAPEGSLRAVSAVYPDHPSVDESRYIQIVADHLGLPLHTYVPQAGALDDVQMWVDVLDGPVDTLSIPLVAEAYRAARAAGARSVITGEVEEDALEIRQFLLDHLVGHRRWSALADQIASRRRNDRTWAMIVRALIRPLLPPRIAATLGRTRPSGRLLPAWIDRTRVGGGTRQDDLARKRSERWRDLQTAPLFGQAITFEADEMCAARCGVTVARPFADIELWEFALSLPAETKFVEAVSKPLLREAMRGLLPQAILDRRDKTFFNEYSLSRSDYPALRKWILASPYRMSGVDYAQLAERLEREDLDVIDLRWARDLARIHAFAALW
jgi:asparagine synthase (glutamine-hydrolysing)